MQSNCYLVIENTKCIIIDPASEKSEDVIAYIEKSSLCAEYIILTHEHSDHTWGVNALLEYYPQLKVVTCEACKKELPNAWQSYFKYYYDDLDYSYYVKRIDVVVEDLGNKMEWEGHSLRFLYTPGHSRGSMCFSMDDLLFSGDTLMMSKPFLNKRDGNRHDYENSLSLLLGMYGDDIKVFPGHGESFTIKEYKARNVK